MLKVGATYEHVKTGKQYKLVALGKQAHGKNELEDIVVYEALYDNPVSQVWVRPKENFLGDAQSPDGSMHPRFKLVE